MLTLQDFRDATEDLPGDTPIAFATEATELPELGDDEECSIVTDDGTDVAVYELDGVETVVLL